MDPANRSIPCAIPRHVGNHDWSDRWLEPDELWDLHGPALYGLARLVLEDRSAAVLAVTLGLMEVYRVADPVPTLPAAARHVHRHCRNLAPDESSHVTTSPSAMEALGEVARSQRSAIALCFFGGHTYREAATELGIDTEAVAWLLVSGLQELGQTGRAPRVDGSA